MIKQFAIAVVAGVGLSLASAGAAQAQDDAKVKKGAELYAANKCQMCHSVEGKGNAKGALDGVGTKYTADEIREWLVNPQAMAEKHKPARTMKPTHPTKLPKEDMDALVAYLQTLKKK
jgi:mono/diheme cytochrome c family protein